ncbi:MAG: peptidylprolyl isomerase [Armatimonadota bacterium]|nr:peptidylprolyl isomerase [Armatimonadota bacterium]MDW8104766.1 peptidylprolyl isomerase [Armatimonadota bacterium]MDW8290655.1 peptidylprolyl isomerase [Armatimonadota bacterium]
MKRIGLSSMIAVLLALVWGSGAWGQAKPPASKPAAPQKPAPRSSAQPAPVAKPASPAAPSVVGRVGGAVVTREEMLRTMEAWYGPQVVEELLAMKVVEQEARKYGVTATKAEIDQRYNEAIEGMRARVPPGADVTVELAKQGWTRAHMEAVLRRALLLEKLVARTVRDDDFIQARHILIQPQMPAINPDQSVSAEERQKLFAEARAKAEEDAKAKAQKVYEEIKAGKDFAEAAKEYSDDRSNKDRGGDLGAFARGMMVPEFEQAAFALKPGEVSEPVKTPYGWHIIKVERLGRDIPAAEKARLTQLIVRQRIGQYYQELLRRANAQNLLLPKPAASAPAQPAPQRQTMPAPPPAPQLPQ